MGEVVGPNESVVDELAGPREAVDDGVGAAAELVGAGAQAHGRAEVTVAAGREDEGGAVGAGVVQRHLEVAVDGVQFGEDRGRGRDGLGDVPCRRERVDGAADVPIDARVVGDEAKLAVGLGHEEGGCAVGRGLVDGGDDVRVDEVLDGGGGQGLVGERDLAGRVDGEGLVRVLEFDVHGGSGHGRRGDAVGEHRVEVA